MCDPAVAQSSAPPAPSAKNHTGAIVGGVVGGVLGLALIFGVVFWAIRKKGSEQQTSAVQQSDIVQCNELHGYQQSELAAGKIVYGREAFEVEAPLVELGGQEVKGPGERMA